MSKMYVITDDGYFLASETFTPPELLTSLFQTTYQVFNQIVSKAPDETTQAKLKSELYDMFNEGASHFLEAWIPDNLRPDLTAEAIMKAENEILDETVPTVSANTESLVAAMKEQMRLDGIEPKKE